MDLTRSLDIYCERLGPGYWGEPLNAVSNAAFLVAALIMWRRIRGAGLPLAEALVAILAAIGVGSYLWHTHARVWAVILDSGSIAVFALVFLYAANRDLLGLRPWLAGILAALYFPYTALAGAVFGTLPIFAISAEYWGLPVLMLVYGLGLLRRAPETGRGLLGSAALLTLSLGFRTVDGPLCGLWPWGTHFLWHCLNAVLLGWMIEVYRRHMAARVATVR